MNIVKFEEKVIEIIDNSNFFKTCKEHNNYNSPSTDSTEYGETPFNFNVSADTYDELFSLAFKIFKPYITDVSKTKEETSEEGKGE